MVLKNVTKNTILAKDLKEAKSALDLTLGLLRKSNPRSLLFRTNLGIHTFGLKEAIDVLVLDGNFRVVKLKQNLKPDFLFFWNPKYNLVLELPVGTIKKSKTTILDLIRFEN